jgi:hypothetical protein
VNQCLNLLKSETGSNLADMGRAAVHVVPSFTRDTTLTSDIDADHEATVSLCDVTVARPQQKSWTSDPVDRNMVNVGTTSVSPSSLRAACAKTGRPIVG